MASPLAWLRRQDAAWRARWSADLSSPWNRAQAWFDMIVIDHAFLRILWTNRAEIAPGIWRSNQPWPGQLRRLKARLGLKSVINLRGANGYGSYFLERDACAALDLKLYDLRMLSREPPAKDRLAAFRALLAEAERPLLMHCKSGADRAGLAAAVCLLDQGMPADRAKAQLSLRYLHVRAAKTGVLDHFIDAYAAAQAQTGIAFWDWVATDYDPAAMKADFKSNRAADAVIGGLMRRE